MTLSRKRTRPFSCDSPQPTKKPRLTPKPATCTSSGCLPVEYISYNQLIYLKSHQGVKCSDLAPELIILIFSFLDGKVFCEDLDNPIPCLYGYIKGNRNKTYLFVTNIHYQYYILPDPKKVFDSIPLKQIHGLHLDFTNTEAIDYPKVWHFLIQMEKILMPKLKFSKLSISTEQAREYLCTLPLINLSSKPIHILGNIEYTYSPLYGNCITITNQEKQYYGFLDFLKGDFYSRMTTFHSQYLEKETCLKNNMNHDELKENYLFIKRLNQFKYIKKCELNRDESVNQKHVELYYFKDNILPFKWVKTLKIKHLFVSSLYGVSKLAFSLGQDLTHLESFSFKHIYVDCSSLKWEVPKHELNQFLIDVLNQTKTIKKIKCSKKKIIWNLDGLSNDKLQTLSLKNVALTRENVFALCNLSQLREIEFYYDLFPIVPKEPRSQSLWETQSDVWYFFTILSSHPTLERWEMGMKYFSNLLYTCVHSVSLSKRIQMPHFSREFYVKGKSEKDLLDLENIHSKCGSF